ncbi:MAG: hypothetical protein J6B98_01080 [Bacilli bacterium]|nr:hypothetical protein [Bacilli bacterium]
MEDNSYLIPANAKKSTLILGFFTPLDLIVFCIGVGFSIIMLLTISTSDFVTMILIIIPALTSATLVMPVPHYHNVMQLLINIFSFLFSQRCYKWKGWCINDEE